MGKAHKGVLTAYSTGGDFLRFALEVVSALVIPTPVSALVCFHPLFRQVKSVSRPSSLVSLSQERLKTEPKPREPAKITLTLSVFQSICPHRMNWLKLFRHLLLFPSFGMTFERQDPEGGLTLQL